jgi:hypothetical protein
MQAVQPLCLTCGMSVLNWAIIINHVENSGIWSKIDGSSSEQVCTHCTVSYVGPIAHLSNSTSAILIQMTMADLSAVICEKRKWNDCQRKQNGFKKCNEFNRKILIKSMYLNKALRDNSIGQSWMELARTNHCYLQFVNICNFTFVLWTKKCLKFVFS